MIKWIQRQLSSFWPVEIKGDEEFGYTAKLPWDKNWTWAAKRENAILGCRQRAKEKL